MRDTTKRPRSSVPVGPSVGLQLRRSEYGGSQLRLRSPLREPAEPPSLGGGAEAQLGQSGRGVREGERPGEPLRGPFQVTEDWRRVRIGATRSLAVLCQTPGKWVVNHLAASSGVASGPRRPDMSLGPLSGGACLSDWAPASDAGFWERTDTGSGTRKGGWSSTPPTSETHVHRCRPVAGDEGGGEP